MKISLAIIFLLFFYFSAAQQNKVDSLVDILKSTKQDTIKLKTYKELSNLYMASNIELSQKYCDSIILGAIENNLPQFELTGYALNGIIQYRQANFQKALDIWINSLKHPQIDNYPTQKGNFYNNIASGYKTQNHTDSVIKYFNKSIEMYKKRNRSDGLAGCYFNLSTLYIDSGEYDKAILYLDKLKKIALEKDDKKALLNTHISLATISRLEYDFDDAIKHYQKALTISKKTTINPLRQEAIIYEMALAKFSIEHYNSAIEDLEFLKLKFSLNDRSKSANPKVYSYLILSQIQINDIDNAKKNYEVLSRLKLPESSISRAIMYLALSNFEIETDETNKYTLNRLNKAKNLAEVNKEYYYSIRINKQLAKFHSKKKSFQKSHDFLSRAILYSDSLNNVQTRAINLSQKRKFNEAENENKILSQSLELEEKDKKNRQTLYLASIIGLIALFLGYLLYKRKKQQQLDSYKYNQEVSRLKKSKELQQKTIIKQIQRIDNLQQTMEEKETFANLQFKEKEDKFHDILMEKYQLTQKLLQYWIDQANGVTEKEMMRLHDLSAGGIESRRKRLYEKIKEVEEIDPKIWLTREEATRIYRENWQNFNK